jgi:hypothetical protein
MGVGKKKSLQSNLVNSRENSVSPTPHVRRSNPGSGAKLSEYNLDDVDIQPGTCADEFNQDEIVEEL